MTDDLQQQLDLAKRRAGRFKQAKNQAELLLEQKSRELYEANIALEKASKHLQLDYQDAMGKLSKTNQRLQESLDEKSNFIGSVSHEVRTPLNAIIGLSELMLKTNLDHTQQDFVETINDGAKSLMVLIDDILSITKVEAGRVNLNPTVIQPTQTIRNVLGMFKLKAKEQGIKLKLKVSQTVPDHIKIDEGRYKQIINNLINNALRHTTEGSITVTLGYQANKVSDGVGFYITQVTDTGEGIEKENLKRIFNTYEQIGNPNQGVGLGLAICQQLSELMMGKVTCESESEIGIGSTFTAYLPAAEACAETIRVVKQKNDNLTLPDLKILLAEDNPTNQKVVRAQLAQLGQNNLDIVGNGALALEKLSAQSYDVVVLDILMPVMDGEQTIQNIRQSAKKISQNYCIALTASTYLDQRQRLMKLGFDDFLSKPVTLQELHGALVKVPMQAAIVVPNSFSNQAEEPTEQQISFNHLKQQFGDAYQTIFKQIAPSFLEHSYKELLILQDSVNNNDHALVKKTSHSMKGAAASMGFKKLADLLFKIESEPTDTMVQKWLSETTDIMDQIRPVIVKELNSHG